MHACPVRNVSSMQVQSEEHLGGDAGARRVLQRRKAGHRVLERRRAKVQGAVLPVGQADRREVGQPLAEAPHIVERHCSRPPTKLQSQEAMY